MSGGIYVYVVERVRGEANEMDCDQELTQLDPRDHVGVGQYQG